MKNRNLIRKNKNLIPYWLVAIILLIFGLVLIFISEKIDSIFWKSVLNKLATAITITGIFSLINNFFLSMNLIDIILEKINLKHDLNDTGLTRVHTNYNNIPFMEYFNKENDKIVIAHNYGKTWTRNYQEELKKQINNNDCEIKILIQNPESSMIKGIADHFEITEDNLKKRINETIEICTEIRDSLIENKKEKLKLYLVKKIPSYSMYQFDNDIVAIINPLSQGTSKALNTIVVTDNKVSGNLFNNFQEDLKKLLSKTENHYQNI